MGSYVIFESRLTNSFWPSAFARLSRPVNRPHGIRELFFDTGQSELKHGAARLVRLRPQPAPMGIDDGPADRQPHSRSAGLCRVERLENALAVLRVDARSGIA